LAGNNPVCFVPGQQDSNREAMQQYSGRTRQNVSAFFPSIFLLQFLKNSLYLYKLIITKESVL
jgi:hypothetical protein